ncbi:MAG: 2Fe-2S iron-sulfur cluster binding domain-containing protein, partial [Chloroflexi bacterium]|nr:2Fe-2S iron-sulfur cluster binding domain-containing protein [Chloroflexota bacterium]
MTKKFTVILQPSGRRGEIDEGTNLRTAARQLGADIESICAENGTCGKCKVLVEDGTFERYGITSSRENLTTAGAEEAAYFARHPKMLATRGWEVGQVRLACQTKIRGDVLINVPEESRGNKQIVRKSATERAIDIKPSIRKYLVELRPPTLSNPK